MARDWSADWEAVLAEERAAHDELLDSFSRVTTYFGQAAQKLGQNPPLADLDEYDAAHQRWEKAKAGLQRFLEDFWAAHPRGGFR